MKQILCMGLLFMLPLWVIGQRNLKFNYKQIRTYNAASSNWSQVKEADRKYVFKFKKNEIVQSSKDGSAVVHPISSFSEATDEHTLEDCYLIFTEIDGVKLRLVLYRDDSKGLRIIQKNGDIENYFNEP